MPVKSNFFFIGSYATLNTLFAVPLRPIRPISLICKMNRLASYESVILMSLVIERVRNPLPPAVRPTVNKRKTADQ